MFFNFIHKRHKKYYQESKIHLFIDLAFVIIIIVLIISNIILFKKTFPIEDIQININRHQVDRQVEQKKEPQIINTNLILNANLVYYTPEGEQLGIGPWPPVVGETTLVRIVLNVTTNIHSVKNLQFKAKLPTKITWVGKSAVNLGQAIFYDNASGLIIWSLDNLDINQKAQASFEIEFTPKKDDLRHKIKLLENLKVSGVDKVTGQGISTTKNDLYSLEVKK